MDLKTWLDAEPGRSQKLADFLTSWVRDKSDPERTIQSAFISSIKNGGRPCPPSLARGIEKFTGGDVMPWDTCPNDWRLFWPEFETHRGAPEPLRTEVMDTAKG